MKPVRSDKNIAIVEADASGALLLGHLGLLLISP